MNIHDRARRLVAQSKGPMTLSEAYAALARRRVRKQTKSSKVNSAELAFAVSPEPGGFWWQRD